MDFSSYPFSPLPPCASPPDDVDLARYLGDISKWTQDTVQGLLAVQNSLKQILNGGVGLPDASSNTKDASNLGISLVRFTHLPARGALAGTYFTPAIPVPHGLERPAKGWWELGRHVSQVGHLLLDEIVSSVYPSVYGEIGYATADVNATDSRAIAGTPILANQWTSIGVQEGDQIKLWTRANGADTAATEARSAEVTRGISGWTGEVQPGWMIRFPLAVDPRLWGWFPIASVKNDDVIVLSVPIPVDQAATPYELLEVDTEWLTITAIDGTGPTDTLTLDPQQPGTLMPLGTTGCQYVIRRPPDGDVVWVRPIPLTDEDSISTTLAVF